MIRSMTGFGRAAGDFDGQQVNIELSAVNHRFLDCSVRLPSSWAPLEPVAKEIIKTRLSRGKVNVSVGRKRAGTCGRGVHLDSDVARQYVEASQALAGLLGVKETLTLNTLAGMDGVFYQEDSEEDLDAVQKALAPILEEALTRVNAMRETEGKALEEDIRYRIALIRESLAAVESRLPELNRLYEERLRTRIDELKSDVGITDERIAIEVAFLAEKADVTEEVVRLKTHLDHMVELLGSDEVAVGRKLDFLAQEVQREVNTLGVKTRDADVSKEIIAMKAEVEKIREQVQNVE